MVRQLFPKVIQIESWQRQTSNIDLLTSNSYQNHDHCFLSFNNTLGVNHNQNLTDELKLCSKVIHSFSYNQILLKRKHWQSTPEIPESENNLLSDQDGTVSEFSIQHGVSYTKINFS